MGRTGPARSDPRLIRRLDVSPVRDVGRLDAAVARRQSSAFGVDAYPSIEGKAGALLRSIVRNHALVDGNKRLGWLATAVFLDLNGHPVEFETTKRSTSWSTSPRGAATSSLAEWSVVRGVILKRCDRIVATALHNPVPLRARYRARRRSHIFSS